MACILRLFHSHSFIHSFMLGLDLCVRHCCLSVFLLLNGPFFCLNKKHCKYCCQSQRLRRELHSGVQHIDLISPGFFNRSMDAIKHTNHLSRSFYLRSAPHGRNALGLLTPPHLSNGWSCFVRYLFTFNIRVLQRAAFTIAAWVTSLPF